MPADLVLLAIGFDGVACESLVQGLGGHRGPKSGAIAVDQDLRAAPGVFAGGDATRGASPIVWAIAEGRESGGGLRPVPRRFALTAGPRPYAGPRADPTARPETWPDHSGRG